MITPHISEKDELVELADALLFSQVSYLCTDQIILTTLPLSDFDLEVYLRFFHYKETTFWIAPNQKDILHKLIDALRNQYPSEDSPH